MSTNPPGWYPDPSEPDKQRYWDGTSWTEHVTPAAASVPPTPPVYGTTPPGTNGLAITSFVLSLLTLCGVGSLLGVIFGHVSLRQIKREHQRGRGLAIAGLVLGYLGMAGIVVLVIALATSSTDDTGVTAGSPTTIEANDRSKEAPTTAAANAKKAVAVSGFTKYNALGQTWVSVGIVLTGLSGGSQELTISLLDAAGTPIATNTEYVGSDREGGQVLVSSTFTDNTPTAASVRVDITNASSFVDETPFPVTVASQGFDGNVWTVKGTAKNDRSENITLGSIDCVAFKNGKPVAGASTAADTIVPGAQVAWQASETFDPHADGVRCQGEAS